mmetsp:Transcript_23805/g.40523  ORF Transcript_23805/g.40523 Transcript_23805/m.40523 type:complete len:495 (-) Transcript_23805:146-1630(-)
MSGNSTATTATATYSVEDLTRWYAGYKNGLWKNITILRSVSSIVSVIFSSLLIALIFKSKDRLSTTYHRLLLGMAISDILFSLPMATFGAMDPTDLSYILWNARGNQAICTLHGFVSKTGGLLSLCYTCSLILYYLAKVKYRKTESFIRYKLEPFFHGLPFLIVTVIGVVGLVNKNYNTVYGGCTLTPVYDPPHCEGLEDGTVREGFTIPCGRGRNKSFFGWYSSIVLMVPPFIIIIAFGMIYWSVREQEKKNGRYGAGTLNLGASTASSSNDNGRDSNTRGSARSSIGSIRSTLSSISSRFRRNSSVVGNDSNSRAVMHRAFAYAMAYFTTWIWALIGEIMTMLKVNVPMWYGYIWTIMIPLQGMFNFLVYFHPMVKSAGKKASREGKDLWYIQAFGKALLKGLGLEGCQCCTKKEKKSQSATMTEDTSAAPTASTCRRSSLFEQVLEEEKVDIDIEAAPKEEDDEFSTLDQRLEEEKVNIGIDAAPEDCGSD